MGDDMGNCPSAADLARGRVPRDAADKLPALLVGCGATAARDRTAAARASDVAIVGSGYTGLSAALTLLRRGRQAVVLERGVPGYGASTRNGGQIGSGNQKFRVKKLIELRGREKAVALLREGTRMLDYIARPRLPASAIDCQFTRCGRFRGAIRPEHYEAMARDMEDLREVTGVESFMVPRAEQHTEIGTDIFYGGSVLPNDASLHPGLYHAGLMQRVEEAGGSVVGEAGVSSIAKQGSGFRVSTAAGEIQCRDVIVATDGYTDARIPELHRRIVPVGSALIATGEIPADALRQAASQEARLWEHQSRHLLFQGRARRAAHHLGRARRALGFAQLAPRFQSSRARDARRLSGSQGCCRSRTRGTD